MINKHRFSASLRPGIPLVGAAADRKRLRLSKGIVSRRGAADDIWSSYDADVVVPRPIWREPSGIETRLLRAVTLGSQNFVSIIGCDVASVRALQQRLGTRIDRTQLPAKIYDPSHREVLQILADIHVQTGLISRGAISLGVFSAPPNQANTTIGPNKKRIGMHVDSWSDLPLARRGKAPNRLCINLGQEPRFLLMVNQSVSSLPDLLHSFVSANQQSPTELAREFLKRNSAYPVVSIRVDPLEGYIAPTENMIHDGSTLNQQSHDVVLTLLGYFGLPAFMSEM